MRLKALGRATAVGLSLLLVSATAVWADNLDADADALATSSPAGNGLEAIQQPGTSVEYDLSATIDETGNATDNVFPGTVVVTIARSGAWLDTSAGSPSSFTFTAYDTNQAGKIRITVPCGTAEDTEETMRAVLTAGASTNGNELSPNSVTLSYSITAAGEDDPSCPDPDPQPTPTPTPTPNQAPVADAGGPYSGSEGSPISLDGTGSSDPDSGPSALTYKWTVDSTGIDGGGSCSFDNDTLASAKLTCTDNGSATVTLEVSDGEDTDTDNATVTVGNANPAISGTVWPTASLDCDTNTVNLSVGFSDAGSNDTHTASIDWGDGSNTVSVDPASSPVTASHTYAAGGPYSASFSVSDDDTGSDSEQASFAVLYDSSGIKQPINAAGTRSVFKLGSVIPVKVTFYNCDGSVADGLAPVVSLKRVDPTPEAAVNEAPPAASADFGNVMRWSADGIQYIFNLSTKRSQFNGGSDLVAGTYDLKISVGSVVQTSAVFDLKK